MGAVDDTKEEKTNYNCVFNIQYGAVFTMLFTAKRHCLVKLYTVCFHWRVNDSLASGSFAAVQCTVYCKYTEGMGEGEKPALGGGVGKVVGGWVEGGGWMGHILRRTVTHNTDRDRTQDRYYY